MEKKHPMCSLLEELLKNEWMDRPPEIGELEARQGAEGFTFAVHINAMRETQEVLELIAVVRSAVKNRWIALEAASSFLGHALVEKGNKLVRYYKIKEFPRILNTIGTQLQSIGSSEVFLEIIDALGLYVGRYNYWLDADLQLECS